MKIRTVLLSLIISTITCLIAAQCVYRTVEKLRFKLLPEPSAAAKDGTVPLHYINPRPADARILAIRIINNADQDQLFVIRQSGTGIISFSAKKHSEARRVIRIPEAATCSQCRMTILGQNADWELHTAEVRNMYGFSSAWLKAVLTEKSFQNYTKLKPLELGLLFLLTFLLSTQLLLISFPKKLLVLAALISLFSVLVFIVSYLSDFKILLSATALIKLWILAFLPFWIIQYSRLRNKPNFRPVLVILIVGLIFTGGMLSKLDDYEGNFSGFLHISKKFLGRNDILYQHPEIKRELIKVDTNGYDGQFFYFMVFDPLIQKYHFTSNPAERAIDVPMFRYRRIAYPVLTKLVAWNNPSYYPAAMMFLIIAGASICGFFISKAAVNYELSGWEGLALILFPAFWFSLSMATPEPLAAGFLAAAFFLTLKKRYLIAAILFSLAVLTRESAALFVVMLAALEFRKTKQMKPGLILIAALVPYFAWRSFVTISLFHLNGWKGFFFEPATLSLPFAGVIEVYNRIAAGSYPEVIKIQALTLPLLLLILLCVCLYAYVRTKNPAAIIGAVYAFLALSLSYDKVWMDVSNVERTSYESFLCFALLFATRPKFGKLNVMIYGVGAVLLIYDFFIMMRSDVFESGLLWVLKC